ncbi:hypothetical protein FNV43_RR19571 [Rhamnella rubrinervis]|uniref:Uncharacterized protein n=1 Tax=Rhamnella rubrinervis TaxID=2594499 RepID=A0A8K0DYS6_9ROSA|nr:hypothetical protein FNV43_RR19571 [Rhamnella rubrinervis]
MYLFSSYFQRLAATVSFMTKSKTSHYHIPKLLVPSNFSTSNLAIDNTGPNEQYGPDEQYGLDEQYGPDEQYELDEQYDPDEQCGSDDSEARMNNTDWMNSMAPVSPRFQQPFNLIFIAFFSHELALSPVEVANVEQQGFEPLFQQMKPKIYLPPGGESCCLVASESDKLVVNMHTIVRPFQNHGFPTNFPVQGIDFSMLNHGFHVQQFSGPHFQPQNSRELLEKVDRAMSKARRDLLAAESGKKCLSPEKGSRRGKCSALLMLQVDYWGSLGFQM